ncbi:Secondary metabolism regulator laeA [Colletotrichum trifolii]|uniref:Secondary metabolism regulator laeA n=1 Tax=Colletotrichum trifolii TaxID=5466 RepID=A0A4V3HXI5_COLTR|nr:Secondary metabolism regulator laeA [Colletotrichum trifolii]
MDSGIQQRLRKRGGGGSASASSPGSPVGRRPRPSTAANSISATSTSTSTSTSSSTLLTATSSVMSSSSERPPRYTTSVDSSRPRTPPSTRQSGQANVLLQHQIIAELFDGRLHLAPVVKARAALDVGTGPGLWALNPTCAVVGVDIEKVRAPYAVPNCSFRVMDVTAPWKPLDNRRFDYIHVRMLGDVSDKEQFVQQIYKHLNPGGWVEICEWVSQLHSPNRSLDGSAFARWNALLRQGLRNMGRSMGYPHQYLPALERAGFERVSVTKHAAITNACYPGKRSQRFGAMMTSNWNAIIEPLSVPVFTIGLGWSEGQVLALLRDVRREIGDPNYHSFITLLTVYCRKPRSGMSSSASLSSSSRSLSAKASMSTTNLSTHAE